MKYQAVITKLNLSTHPFRNRNLPYLIALLLLVAAAFGAFLCFVQLRSNGQSNELAAARNRQMQDDIKQLNDKGTQVQQKLSPQQQALLIDAHKLVANKTFGWSRLFADLESVLPGGVSASRIKVANVYSDGDKTKAELELSVLSRDYQTVVSMIDSMNNSGQFQAELKGQDLQKNERGMNYTEYSLRVIYIPNSGYSESPAGDVAQAGGDR